MADTTPLAASGNMIDRASQRSDAAIQAGTEAAKTVALHRPVNQPGGVPALGYQASF